MATFTNPAGVWTLDKLVGFADLNTYLRDNFTEIRDGLYTTVYKTSNQSIADTGSGVVISWNAETPRDTAIWAIGSPTRLTVPTGFGGRWLLAVHLDWTFAWGTTQERRAGYKINGGSDIYQIADMACDDIANTSYFLVVLKLNAGDYVEVFAHQVNSTVSINSAQGLGGTRAIFRWLGPAGTEGQGLEWREPIDWSSTRPVLRWNLATDLDTNVRLLRNRQEASLKAYLKDGEDFEVGTGQDLRLAWDTADWNYGGIMQDPPEEAASKTPWRTSQFRVKKTGIYLVWVQAPWDTPEGLVSRERRDVRLILNDSDAGVVTERTQTTISATAGDGYFRQCATWVYLFAEGDTIQLELFNKDPTNAMPINTGQFRGPLFGLEMLSALPAEGVSVPGWTALSTWASSNVPTVTNFTQQIHDNLLNLRYGRSAACVLIRDGNQAIDRDTDEKIVWSRALVNVGSMWSSGTNITVPVAGRYAIYGHSRWEAYDNHEYRSMDFFVGTTLYYGRGVMSLTSDSWGPHFSFYTEINLAANDVVSFSCYQDSATTLDIRHPTQCAVVLLNNS